jgi:hypothetical protein
MIAETLPAPSALVPVAKAAPKTHAVIAARNVLMAAIGIQLALLLPSLLALTLDDRIINHISVWVKPIKFQSSLIMLLATLVLLLPLIDPVRRGSRAVRWWATAAAVSATGEIAYIVLQSARGRASHFNNATPIESVMYSVMGAGAVILVVSSFAVGWMIWRNGNPRFGAGLRLGGAVGLMLGGVLTLITAGYLGSANSHWIGGIASDANGLFLMGWSRSGGDLRVPHFFATHVMQALPVLGLLADRLYPRSARQIVVAGSVISVLVVVHTFAQALSGRPFI